MKAGSTSLYRYMQQHSNLFLPDLKEPNYHRLQGVDPKRIAPAALARSTTTRLAYQELFRGARPEQQIGEGSIHYILSPAAARSIHTECPAARFLCILRNPAERAWSHYTWNRQLGREPIDDFGRALDAEADRFDQESADFTYAYCHVGRYYHQLRAYDELFAHHQFKFFLYEEFCAKPQAVLQEAFRFLGVDDSFRADPSVRYNVTGVGRGAAVARLQQIDRLRWLAARVVPAPLLSRLGRWTRKPAEPLADDNRELLIGRYRSDILALQDRIDRDLSGWLLEKS